MPSRWDEMGGFNPSSGDRGWIGALASIKTLWTPPLPLLPPGASVPALLSDLDRAFTDSHRGGHVRLPFLKNYDKAWIVSDYAGDHTAYETYSFLLTGRYQARGFLRRVQELRNEHGLIGDDYQTIDYKSLGTNGRVQRFLPPFARLARELLPGMIFTLAVRRSLRSVFGPDGRRSSRMLADALTSDGIAGFANPLVAERSVRIAVVLTYLTHLLCGPRQPIAWLTDRDKILDTPQKQDGLLRLLSGCSAWFNFDDVPGPVGIKVNDDLRLDDGGDPRDILAVPDLFAGAVADGLSKWTEPGAARKPGVDEVFKALRGHGPFLRSLTVSVDDLVEGRLQLSTWRWETAKRSTPES